LLFGKKKKENTSSKMMAPQDCKSLAVNNLDIRIFCFVIICNHMFFGEWLVDISFAVLLGGAKFGMCAD
jgi:hypothetical protein